MTLMCGTPSNLTGNDAARGGNYEEMGELQSAQGSALASRSAQCS
jgi:hypothetical protein